MKLKMKKYPLLISMIVSCLIIVASLFVLGFSGMRVGTSLGGGSQFEVNVANGASSKQYVSEIKSVLSDNGLTFDSSTLEDKYVAIDNEGNFSKQVLIVKISQSDVKDEVEAKVIEQIAAKLQIDKSTISVINNITAYTTGKNVLMLGVAIAIVAVALFVFAWIRYDVLAGLSFIVAFLHNIIVYFSLLILTRLELNLTTLTVMFILTLVMSLILIHIYEKYRTESRLHISDKLSVSERMIGCESAAVKPFVIVAAAVIVVSIFMLFVPVPIVKFTALSIILALLTTAYTALFVGPATYVALLDVVDVRNKAILSRNDNVNKVIKKKIKTSKKEKEQAEKQAAKVKKEEPEILPVQEEKKVEKKVEEKKEPVQTAPKKKTTQKTIRRDYSKFKK